MARCCASKRPTAITRPSPHSHDLALEHDRAHTNIAFWALKYTCSRPHRHRRTHQIRVHLSQPATPSPATLYGAPTRRPWLHAFQVTFTQPTSGATITLEAPLPADLEAWKNGLL